jgi:hypothetical protein
MVRQGGKDAFGKIGLASWWLERRADDVPKARHLLRHLQAHKQRKIPMPFPTELSETWQFLHNEVTWLHGRWTMYRQLYGTSPERIELLNRVAPTFFGTIQAVQLDEIQLTLSRLADPVGTGQRRNLGDLRGQTQLPAPRARRSRARSMRCGLL